MSEILPTYPILFYDGNCAVCSSLVQFMLKIEKHSSLYFASLQGQSAQQFLPSPLINDLNTVVLINKNIISIKSQAILNCLEISRPLFIWSILKLIPRPIRDALYTLFASHRHHFLKNSQCFIPNAKQKYRFLP